MNANGYVWAVIVAGLCTLPTWAADPPIVTRPFYMGLGRTPFDLSIEGFLGSQEFANVHSDLATTTFTDGIPWPEALAGQPFSKDVDEKLRHQVPVGKKHLLSISPLSRDRKKLASYWGNRDNLPLPAPWNTYAIDSPEVKKAYLNFTTRAIRALNPDYVCIAIECNTLLSHEPDKWPQFKELYKATYAGLKKAYPKLLICFSIDVLHYKQLLDEAKGKNHEAEVADLLKHSDLLGLNVYPHLANDLPRPLPADLLDFAVKLKKPVGVIEAGMTSRDVILRGLDLTLPGSEAEQNHFVEQLLRVATRDRYEFVVHGHGIDLDKLVERLPPPIDDFLRMWAYTGLQTSLMKPKPALAVWDKYLKARYDRRKKN
jgi:hypothetical protein